MHDGLMLLHEVADNRLLFWETGTVGVVLDCVVLLIIVLGLTAFVAALLAAVRVSRMLARGLPRWSSGIVAAAGPIPVIACPIVSTMSHFMKKFKFEIN